MLKLAKLRSELAGLKIKTQRDLERANEKWVRKQADFEYFKQDSDVSWCDYALYNYGHSYGTGYALSTLSRCRVASAQE